MTTTFLACLVLTAIAAAWVLSFMREDAYLRLFNAESSEALLWRFTTYGRVLAMIVVTLLAEVAAAVLALVVLL